MPFSSTDSRRLVRNAICLYVAAYLLTIMLHELGHALTSLMLGGRPVLYNTSVQNTNPALSVTALVRIAVAGPLVSLGQGLLLLGYAHRTHRQGTGTLFLLYLGVFGLMNFLGYLMIAPLVPGGDTGQIVALLRIPQWLQWGTAALALVALSRAIRRTGPLFLALLPTEAQADVNLRTAGLRALLLWPWAVGSVLLVLLAVPAPQVSILLNIPMSSVVLWGALRTGQQHPAGEAPATSLLRPQWLPALAVVVLAGLFRYLSVGVAW